MGRQRTAGPSLPGSSMASKASRILRLNCSTRVTRVQYLETGFRDEFTVSSCTDSSCCRTGPTPSAKTSPGSRTTGSRLMRAAAAPVTMLVDPGPTEAVTASGRPVSLA